MSKKAPFSNLPALLRAAADTIEQHPEVLTTFSRLFNKYSEELSAKPSVPKESEDEPSDADSDSQRAPQLDPYQLLQESGPAGLRARLETLSLQELKLLIKQRGFDTNRLAQKSKDKNRLVDLVIDRASARSGIGAAFRGRSEN